VFALVVNLLFDPSFFLLYNHEAVTKPQSTTQDLIEGARVDIPFAIDRCIYCDLNVKCYTILSQVTRPTEVSRRPLGTCLFIRLKTDTFGHALLQHSLLQVGAQVVYLLKT